MGFLGDLFRREVSKVISNAVDTVVDDTLENVFGKNKDNSGAGNETVKSAYDRACDENWQTTRNNYCSGEELLRKRIEEIAARDWVGYELRRQVPSSEVNAPEGAEPYFEYGFYLDGSLVAVIKILHDTNDYCRRSVRLAQNACREKNVKYMNFMSYMMNNSEYIEERFRKTIQ